VISKGLVLKGNEGNGDRHLFTIEDSVLEIPTLLGVWNDVGTFISAKEITTRP
jgi:hypothetical protein